MNDVTVWVVSPPNYVHAHAFDEVAEALAFSLSKEKYRARIVRDPLHCCEITIVLGANLLPSFNVDCLPKTFIIFNLEQVDQSSHWVGSEYLNLLSKSKVWDYSAQNVERLKGLGILKVELCKIGYAPSLSRIGNSDWQDIDVLFFGSINERRRKVLAQLEEAGLRIKHLFGVYGPRRDEYISRAKVVLNLHFYDAGVFEVVRAFYLLSNKKCIVSEVGQDFELEKPFREAVAFAAYDDLVERCRTLVEDESARVAQEAAGFGAICNLPFSLPQSMKRVAACENLLSPSMPVG